MSEQAQAELPGMPDAEKTVPRWLHLAEIAAQELALASIWMRLLGNLPYIDDGDNEVYAQMAEKTGRYVREQIGMRAWDAALVEAGEYYVGLMDKARAITEREDGEGGR